MRASTVATRSLGYLLAAGLMILTTLVLSALRNVLDTPLIALLLLIPVGLSTAIWGLGPGITAALCAFFGFNYFFISPFYTFTVHRPEDVVVLLVFLIVAVVISQLVGRAQAGMAAAAAREHEATQLYELSTALAGLQDEQSIVRTLAEQLQSMFTAESVGIRLASQESAELRWPSARDMPSRSAELIIPIQAVRGVLGEIRIWREEPAFSLRERRLLQTCASQGALALERTALTQAESRAKFLEESDRFKSSLLSSVSHDLRTPLATIKAAASSLRGGEVSWDSAGRSELVAAIDEEADHLNMLVGNLLDMSRIESGALRPQREWNLLSEIVQTVLGRMRHQTENHRIEVDIPENLPLLPVDFIEMEQVFTNLITNSTKYAPAGTLIHISARADKDKEVVVQVSNEGPPVPDEHLARIFDKFYRVTAADRITGTGLGLSICKGIIEAHGGRIWAENLPSGFAFNFALPLTLDGKLPPELPVEPENL
jgi:two-component system, OmpR family, sensor histidine kinase KdpD